MSNKAIFLDRDDTLIEDPGYINDPDQVKLLEGVPEALKELKTLGFKLVVATNQSAVARGIVTEKVLADIHERLKELLAEKNTFLDEIYYCPYHPDGVVTKYRKESNYRKPNPGMLLEAADDMNIDLNESWCIGNKLSDIEAGLRAGCKTVLVDGPSHQKEAGPPVSSAKVTPDYKAVNMKEAVNIIKKHLRAPAEVTADSGEAEPMRTEPAEKYEQILEVAEPVQESEQQRARPQSQERTPEPERSAASTDELLGDILAQLKNMQRTEMFHEFSVMRLLAGVVQILVLFCLLTTVWFLMSPTRQDNFVFMALGFAIVLQIMALTFYSMHGGK
jgi:D,D-heptose 1,7-bisphosphate phosphatase